MQQPIVLKGTRLGLLSTLLGDALWIGALIIGIHFLNTYIDKTCTLLGYTSVFDGTLGEHSSPHAPFEFFMAGIAKAFMIFCLIVMAFDFLDNLIYGAWASMTLYLDEANTICKMRFTQTSFFLNRKTTETPCNRIISVENIVPTFGIITNTGTVKITFVAFPDVEEKSDWTIACVENLGESVEKIRAALPRYKGTEVLIKKE